MTIKEAAERCGESEHTIRYYCKEGLFPFATRDENGVRHFTEQDMEGINIVLCLRDTGMPLKEIRHYMDLCREGISTLPDRLKIIQTQEKRAEEEMTRMQKRMEHLKEKEQFYKHALETGVEDDSCNPFLHSEDHHSC